MPHQTKLRGPFGLAPAADWRGRGERGCIGRVGVGLSCPAFPVRRRAHSFSPTTATTSTVSINIARSRDGLSPVGWLHSLLLLDSRPLLRPDMVLVGVSWGCPMSHWSVRRKSKQTPCPAFSQVLSCHFQRLRHALRCCFQDGWASSMVWRSATTAKLHIPGAGRTLQPCTFTLEILRRKVKHSVRIAIVLLLYLASTNPNHIRWNRYKKLKRHQTKRQYGISKTTK